MVKIRALTHDHFDAIHATFLEAFSDYLVTMQLTREQFLEMITRRGWVPEVSVGAFEGETMVAFTVNAVEGQEAYDSGTGVIPRYRRQGLGREMMKHSFELLRARGVRRYILEVIEANAKAAELYRTCGFTETRGLQCWVYESSSRRVVESSRGGALQSRWWDVQPSWQNSSPSIARAHDEHVILGDDDGYVVVFPATGDVPQLAVRREARRKGVGRRLVESAAAVAGKPLRFINVDDRNAGIAAFLEHVGARRTVRQLEMARPLD
jgi:ribosomal protein S18 acetylase RimI-like enzyme